MDKKRQRKSFQGPVSFASGASELPGREWTPLTLKVMLRSRFSGEGAAFLSAFLAYFVPSWTAKLRTCAKNLPRSHSAFDSAEQAQKAAKKYPKGW